MRKFIIGLSLSLALTAGCSNQAVETVEMVEQEVKAVQTLTSKEALEMTAEQTVVPEGVDVTKNVGNGLAYTYTISDVEEDEIYGIPVNYANEGNKGIFLYKDEVSFEVDEGDEITVIWGEEEDEFVSIEKTTPEAVETETSQIEIIEEVVEVAEETVETITEDTEEVLEASEVYSDVVAVESIEAGLVKLVAGDDEHFIPVELFGWDVKDSDVVSLAWNMEGEYVVIEFLSSETESRKAQAEELIESLQQDTSVDVEDVL